MKSFRKNILSIAALALISTAAYAGNGGEHNNTGCSGVGNANSPCQGTGGTTHNGGTGGTAAATAVSTSAAIAAAQANAAAIAAQQQAQQQAQLQGQAQQQQVRDSGNSTATGGTATGTGGAAQANGGTGGSATGNGAGNKTAVTVEGDRTFYEAPAPSIAVGNQTAPIVDCRRTIGGGASSQGGSGIVSGFPLWREDDCIRAMGNDLMRKSPDGTFTRRDFQQLSCTNEFVAATDTCKKLKEEKRAETVLEQREVAGLQLYGN